MPDDHRHVSPSVARNKAPILDALRHRLPARGRILEVASGSGEHTVALAGQHSNLTVQPSDPDGSARASIDAWIAHEGLQNVRPAIELDATWERWPIEQVDAIVCINMVHIAPWAATIGLFQGAARHLNRSGLLFMYGPYRRDGQHTSEGNESFDQSLRAQNPAWGIRDLNDVSDVARANGFNTLDVLPMPANNLSLFFLKS